VRSGIERVDLRPESDHARGVKTLLVIAALLAPNGKAPVVCLDPGHARTPNLTTERIGPGSSVRKIKDGGGAPGEAVVVLAMAKKTRTVLIDRGYRVVMTRTGEEFTYGNGGNIARAQFCNRSRAALMLRIHADGSTSPSLHGVATLFPVWRRGWTDDVYRPSRRAAELVQRQVVRRTGALDRGLVPRSDLTGFNWADVPVILVETGFMTNPRERRLLQSDWYQWRIARGLAAGVARFIPLS
jgi:N-acetylmuramoyl-L-alanine amidase